MAWTGPDHEISNTHQTTFDSVGTTVCEAVISCVATVNNQTPLEPPVLYQVIDSDALASIFSSRGTESRDSEVTVTFEYANTRVVVSGHAGHGIVTVTRPQQ